MPVFLDTNILLYASSSVPSDAVKQRIADSLLERRECVLSYQVLQEFYVQATRQSRAQPLTREQGLLAIEKLLRFQIVAGTPELIGLAIDVQSRSNFNYWDCAVIAAAIVGGCDVLYSEDMQHGRAVEGVRIVNPFIEAA